MYFTREELVNFCKTFKRPEFCDIQKWKKSESFSIKFFYNTFCNNDDLVFIGKYIIETLGLELEDSLQNCEALVTFFLVDNFIDHDFEFMNVPNAIYSCLFNKPKTCHLEYYINNVKRLLINHTGLDFDKNTKLFKSGSLNKIYRKSRTGECIINRSISCINCESSYDCNRCINCKYCRSCKSCINCEYCHSSNNLQNCTYTCSSSNCENCTECDRCSDCINCTDCIQCKNNVECNKCKKCNFCEKCLNCVKCLYVSKLSNSSNIDNHKTANWNNVKDIEEIIKEENYKLPIIKIIDINETGWRLECTSEEYVLIYDSDGNVRFKGRLTRKDPAKIESIHDMHLCCGSIYDEHNVLTDILYVSRTKSKVPGRSLSIENFCNGKYLCKKMFKKYDLYGNLVFHGDKY